MILTVEEFLKDYDISYGIFRKTRFPDSKMTHTSLMGRERPFSDLQYLQTVLSRVETNFNTA